MFIQQGCIKLIKVTEKKRVLLFQINTNLLKFLLKKVSWKKNKTYHGLLKRISSTIVFNR